MSPKFLEVPGLGNLIADVIDLDGGRQIQGDFRPENETTEFLGRKVQLIMWGPDSLPENLADFATVIRAEYTALERSFEGILQYSKPRVQQFADDFGWDEPSPSGPPLTLEHLTMVKLNLTGNWQGCWHELGFESVDFLAGHDLFIQVNQDGSVHDLYWDG